MACLIEILHEENLRFNSVKFLVENITIRRYNGFFSNCLCQLKLVFNYFNITSV